MERQTVKRNPMIAALLAGSIAAALAACSTAPAAQPTVAPVVVPTIQPTIAAAAPTAEPETASPPLININLGISGTGEVKAARDASLVFRVPGTVAEVLVKEGDVVTEGQVLAILDTRALDLDIKRAEAALSSVEAQQQGLTEGPRAADIAAANAQVRQAEAALAQLQAGPKEQDLASAQAALTAAQAQLQSTRNQLSTAKTNTQLQMEQAANAVRNAQDAYSRIYWDNRRAEEQLAKFGQELPQAAKDQEAAALRAVENAETALEQAKLAYEQAQKAEITGIQAVEQQVTQAQANVERLQLPPDRDRLAQARAALDQARAARARLNPDPTNAQEAQVAAAVSQAQVGLELAKLQREFAELRAPFDGVVARVNIDPGDPSNTGTLPAISVIDVSKLHVDVPISDVDIAKVALDQQATLYTEALPGQVFTGKVSYIAPTATVVGNVRSFLVRITLDSQEGLRAGMGIRVEIAGE